jgi:hypothetical protein
MAMHIVESIPDIIAATLAALAAIIFWIVVRGSRI